MVLLSDAADSNILYFILFIFVSTIALSRNATFQIFIKNFYQNFLFVPNLLPLSTYISFFFDSFKFSLFLFIDAIYTFFKKTFK